jgi:hypothetical protein
MRCEHVDGDATVAVDAVDAVGMVNPTVVCNLLVNRV